MPKEVDVRGQQFGMLTAIRFTGQHKGRSRLWLFMCDCGTLTVKILNDVRRGRTRSCGCYLADFAIGLAKWRRPPRPRILGDRILTTAERSLRYRQRHPDRVRDEQKKYNETHREEKNAARRSHRMANYARCLEYSRNYERSRRDPFRRQATDRVCRLRLKKEHFLKAKAWAETHPEAMAECPL